MALRQGGNKGGRGLKKFGSMDKRQVNGQNHVNHLEGKAYKRPTKLSQGREVLEAPGRRGYKSRVR